MDGRDFRRVLRGYDPDEVVSAVEQLEAELAQVRAQLEETDAAYTQLRLNAAKQVEDAGAEANAVLAAARTDATRVRDEANQESEQRRSAAEVEAKSLVAEAERQATQIERETQEKVEKANKEVSRAESRAEEIVRFANSRAEKLKSEAAEILRNAEERAQNSDNQIRLATLELERKESEVRDQADAYARKTYIEADRYAQSTERRSRELQAHAEQIVREAKRRAEEIGTQAMDYAKRILSDAVEQMNQVSQDVSGSMTVVNRMRRSVTEQLERVSQMELPTQSQTDDAGVSSVETFIQLSRVDANIDDERNSTPGEASSEEGFVAEEVMAEADDHDDARDGKDSSKA